MSQKIIYFVCALAVLLFAKLFPQAPNFSPAIALCLLSGWIFKEKSYAILLPLTAIIMTDLFMGYSSPLLYVAYAAICMAPKVYKKFSAFHGFITVVNGSFLFFLISNFGVWISTGMYAKTGAGLYQCYLMAMPFFRNTFSSTLIYGVLFAAVCVAIKKLSLVKPAGRLS